MGFFTNIQASPVSHIIDCISCDGDSIEALHKRDDGINIIYRYPSRQTPGYSLCSIDIKYSWLINTLQDHFKVDVYSVEKMSGRVIRNFGTLNNQIIYDIYFIVELNKDMEDIEDGKRTFGFYVSDIIERNNRLNKES